jgi:hypothetical protein
VVNKRISLVRKFWDYKESQCIKLVDPAHEDWILTFAVVKREMSVLGH